MEVGVRDPRTSRIAVHAKRAPFHLSLWLCLYKAKRFSDISQENESYSASMSFGRAFPIMRNSHSRTLSLLLLQSVVIALVSAQGPNKTSPWHTLTGIRPLVIAHGGFSGLFPDSSTVAYDLAWGISLPDVLLWCDVQLTKDGAGICVPDIRLENATDIAKRFKNMDKIYSVNGVPTGGWLSMDFDLSDLLNNVVHKSELWQTPDQVEPSTYQTYGSLLKNLTFIKTFASGILVPKAHIWPVDGALYLQPHTSIVMDAHKEGLEVFTSDFANDIQISYNHSYDPVSECLSFIDNGDFSVDGVLTDFPVTPAEAIEKALVISKCGASGDYPGCTDLAYTKAIADGVDVLDCPVQLTKDGTPFCLSSINLTESTTVAHSSFSNLTTTIPEIRAGSGIFTFSLTWSQIQTLRQKQGLTVTDAVIDALSKAGYDNPTSLKVLIQSSNSSVLLKFKDKKDYELVYKVNENFADVPDTTVQNIKTFADSVVVSKESVFPEISSFLTAATATVSKLKSSNLSVYVETFSNEFVSQAWDFFLDSTVEINSFVVGAKVDGVITDFPKTAARYKRNRCLGLGNNTPFYMRPVNPGNLFAPGPSS
ncbi:putative glycerophosphoryl diester phosphodiesterase 2 [Morella rubra]|uniref:glycerophosphodiester phosphodiesterase n=1 Tax=Morella rubra TaxID=262757 RepID=A0A6A1WIN1_9ROSI|nr:putative glycerophosphoryl diester phosphodiesterase 2 [Morella rubra]